MRHHGPYRQYEQNAECAVIRLTSGGGPRMAVDGHGRAMTIARIRSARLLFLSRRLPALHC